MINHLPEMQPLSVPFGMDSVIRNILLTHESSGKHSKQCPSALTKWLCLSFEISSMWSIYDWLRWRFLICKLLIATIVPSVSLPLYI